MRKIRSILVSAIFVLAACAATFAEDISFKAEVDSNQVTLGNSTHLILTVNGAKKVDQIPLPSIEGMDSRYLGPQTQVSIVNGNYSSTKSFIYVLFSNKAGKFTVPAIAVTIDGKEYKSDPIEIMVEDAPAPAPPSEAKTSGAPSSVSLQDKIMLTLEAPKSEIYMHEQIPINIKLYFGGVNISDVQFPSFDTTGLTKTDFGEPEQTQQVLNGMGFNVVHFKTLISSTRAGELILGPAQLQANILYKNQNQGGGAQNIFGTDIFDNFLTSYERRPFTVNSQQIKINVLPLPDEGKPGSFSGAVGKYDFDVTATPVEVKVGDPITLRMKVTGDGDLKTITMPVFTDASFKTYDPQIKDEGNAKISEQVVIPTSTDVKEVPAVSFSYFDTESKQYKTITKGPFAVTVTAPNPGEEFKAVGFDSANPSVTAKEEVGKDIVFIKEHLDDLKPKGYPIYKTWEFWLAVSIYIILWSVFFSIYLIRKKLKTDTRFARKFKAPRQVRQGLDTAKAYMLDNNTKEFYSILVKTLTEYIGNQFHVPSGGLSYDTVYPLLKNKGVDEEALESIKSIFESADMVRFASLRPDEKNMKNDFDRLKTVIERLEKSL